MDGADMPQAPVNTEGDKRLTIKTTTIGPDLTDSSRLPFQINPVGRKEIKEEILRNETMFWYLVREFKVYFVGHIPIEVIRGLPKQYKYIFGAMAYCLSLGLYSYYLYVNFNSYYNNPLVSLSYNAERCDTVPIVVRDTFLADANGNWEGSNNFSYADASYSFTFSNFEIKDKSEYKRMMATYYASMSELSPIAKQQDLAMNMALWNSYLRFYSLSAPWKTNFTDIGKGTLQNFRFSATPSVTYSRASYGFVLGSSPTVSNSAVSVNCNTSYSMSYEKASGVYRVSYPMSSLEANEACWNSLPAILTSSTLRNSFLLNMELDVNSFSTAVAVNMGFEGLDQLIPVTAEADLIEFEGSTHIGQQFVDIRYPEMTPIYCVLKVDGMVDGDLTYALSSNISDPLCMITYQQGVYIPLTNHMGNSFEKVEACDCNSAIGKSKTCNDFNLMLSLVAFPKTSSGSGVSAGLTSGNQVDKACLYRSLELFGRYNDSFKKLNNASYEAAATGVLTSLNTSARIEGNDFSFCQLSDGTKCSLLTYFTLDEMRKTISPHQYMLQEGSCSAAMIIPEETWSKLVETGPTAFVQTYYECYPTVVRTILYAAGLANGVTSLTMFCLLCILLPIVYIAQAYIRGIPPTPEYSKLMKTITLETLATVLLRVQDENYEGIEQNGIVDKLAQELMNSVQYTMDLDESGSVDNNIPANRSFDYSNYQFGSSEFPNNLSGSNHSQDRFRSDIEGGLTPQIHLPTIDEYDSFRGSSLKRQFSDERTKQLYALHKASTRRFAQYVANSQPATDELQSFQGTPQKRQISVTSVSHAATDGLDERTRQLMEQQGRSSRIFKVNRNHHGTEARLGVTSIDTNRGALLRRRAAISPARFAQNKQDISWYKRIGKSFSRDRMSEDHQNKEQKVEDQGLEQYMSLAVKPQPNSFVEDLDL